MHIASVVHRTHCVSHGSGVGHAGETVLLGPVQQSCLKGPMDALSKKLEVNVRFDFPNTNIPLDLAPSLITSF